MVILANHYVLAVQDLEAEGNWYRAVLGFENMPERGGPGWRFLKRDNCLVMLGECPNALSPAETGDHSYFGYLRVDDIEAFHRRASECGAKVSGPIEDQSWGMREFGLVTPGGHRIMIGQDSTDS